MKEFFTTSRIIRGTMRFLGNRKAQGIVNSRIAAAHQKAYLTPDAKPVKVNVLPRLLKKIVPITATPMQLLT